MEEKLLSPEEVGAEDLAYLGDSVLEVLVRRYLVVRSHGGKKPSESSLRFVTAVAQSDALENILDILTDEESAVFRRARNNYHTSNVPKSATPAQYRRATGFEAVFGYLHLLGREDRIKELFILAYGLDK